EAGGKRGGGGRLRIGQDHAARTPRRIRGTRRRASLVGRSGHLDACSQTTGQVPSHHAGVRVSSARPVPNANRAREHYAPATRVRNGLEVSRARSGRLARTSRARPADRAPSERTLTRTTAESRGGPR